MAGREAHAARQPAGAGVWKNGVLKSKEPQVRIDRELARSAPGKPDSLRLWRRWREAFECDRLGATVRRPARSRGPRAHREVHRAASIRARVDCTPRPDEAAAQWRRGGVPMRAPRCVAVALESEKTAESPRRRFWRALDRSTARCGHWPRRAATRSRRHDSSLFRRSAIALRTIGAVVRSHCLGVGFQGFLEPNHGGRETRSNRAGPGVVALTAPRTTAPSRRVIRSAAETGVSPCNRSVVSNSIPSASVVAIIAHVPRRGRTVKLMLCSIASSVLLC